MTSGWRDSQGHFAAERDPPPTLPARTLGLLEGSDTSMLVTAVDGSVAGA
jgi:hypothetical protein